MVDGELVQYNFLNDYNNDKLITILKNHEALNFDESVKPFALNQLLKRNQTIEDLQKQGVEIDDRYIASRENSDDTIAYSKFAYIFYNTGIILLILHFVFKNNKLPEVASAAIDLSIISLLIYALYYVVTWINTNRFYKNLSFTTKPMNPYLMLVGLPFYGVSHFLLKNKIKEDLDKSCILNVK